MHIFQQLKDAKKARPPPTLNALIRDRLRLENRQQEDYVMENSYKKYGGRYSESRYWQKLSDLPRSVGRELAMQALLLYVVLTDERTPLWAKGLAAGGLAYLILPLDAVPDFLPIGGYSDDAAVMGVVLYELHRFITPAVRERAEGMLPNIFRK